MSRTALNVLDGYRRPRDVFEVNHPVLPPHRLVVVPEHHYVDASGYFYHLGWMHDDIHVRKLERMNSIIISSYFCDSYVIARADSATYIGKIPYCSWWFRCVFHYVYYAGVH